MLSTPWESSLLHVSSSLDILHSQHLPHAMGDEAGGPGGGGGATEMCARCY